MFDDDIAVNNAYYRDLLIPYGSRFTASTKLLENAGEAVMIAFMAELGTDGFSQAHRRLLDTFGLHLREAAALYQQTRRLLASSFAGSALLNRMTRPAFLLSVDRCISFLNDAARMHLASGRRLALRRDRVVATDTESELRLATAFGALVDRLPRADSSDRPIVRLGVRGSTGSIAVSLTALLPHQTMFSFGNLPQVLLMVHTREDRTQSPDILLWEAALNLTPAQSRVALEIYRGRTMKEAARRLHVAESTVRSHLNEVYAKTHTTRQAQLVLALTALGA